MRQHFYFFTGYWTRVTQKYLKSYNLTDNEICFLKEITLSFHFRHEPID